MATTVTRPGPLVRDDEVVFALPDPGGELERVRLAQELVRPRLGPEFERTVDGWELRFTRLEVDRIEYQLELTHADGSRELVFDPANPRRAPGPFGEKSVVEFPGYGPPSWLGGERPPKGRLLRLTLPSRTLRADVSALVWTSAGRHGRRPLPLLVAHDGPEYAALSSLLRLFEQANAEGRLPPFRALLLQPVERDETYSASAAYARALVRELLPALRERVTVDRARLPVAMGASLGALAALHAHRMQPAAFGALFLQSGSYFRQRYDKVESDFPRFRRINRFVGQVLAGQAADDPIPVTLTCGTVEENLHNNRAVAGALAVQGYDVRFHEARDAHNWVAWRDSLDPALVELLGRVWS